MTDEVRRNFCPRCAVKHLGKASILLKETKLGYPSHIWYAMANMSEAEDEIVDMLPEEAAKIREERIKIEQALQESEHINCIVYYTPDFDDLMMMVAKAGLLEEAQEE